MMMIISKNFTLMKVIWLRSHHNCIFGLFELLHFFLIVFDHYKKASIFAVHLCNEY